MTGDWESRLLRLQKKSGAALSQVMVSEIAQEKLSFGQDRGSGSNGKALTLPGDGESVIMRLSQKKHTRPECDKPFGWASGEKGRARKLSSNCFGREAKAVYENNNN